MDCKILRPVSYDLTEDDITFVVPATALYNLVTYAFFNCSAVRDATGSEFVYIQIDGTSYNVLDRAGNWLRYGRLRPNTRIRLVYGADPADNQHFLVIHDLPCECLTNGATAAAAATVLPS